MPFPRTTRIVIRNNVADLATLTAAMERVGAEHGMPEKSLFQLQVALDEMVSNVIKYAWPEGGTHDIEIHIAPRDDRVEVRSSTMGGCTTHAMRRAATSRCPARNRSQAGWECK